MTTERFNGQSNGDTQLKIGRRRRKKKERIFPLVVLCSDENKRKQFHPVLSLFVYSRWRNVARLSSVKRL